MEKKANKIIKEILEKEKIDIKTKKKYLEIYSEIKSKLEFSIKQLKIHCEIFLGGSFAKGTILKDNIEFDIFARFSKDYKDQELSLLLKQILDETKLTYQKVHGSRDYYQLNYNDIKIEIIPIYKINKVDEAVNITDISPFHVEWVTKNIKGLENDVKLAKLFCKAHGIYGAESYIQGFSGYVLEILIAHYGGFLKLLENASKWNNKTIIDVQKHYKNTEELIKELNKAKKISPLIVIDPIQKERNASCAISEESYAKFVLYSQEFLDNPSENHFKIETMTHDKILKKIKDLDAHSVHLQIESSYDNKDILGSKIRKLNDFLDMKLYDAGFDILISYKDLANIWIIYLPKVLPKYSLRRGPEIFNNKDNVKNFIASIKRHLFEKTVCILFL